MNICEAVGNAVKTAKAQPACVPHLPEGWFGRADQALVHAHPQALELVALELVDAHVGCRASWDHWPWLSDLRDATAEAQARRLGHERLATGDITRAVLGYKARTGATEARAKAALGI